MCTVGVVVQYDGCSFLFKPEMEVTKHEGIMEYNPWLHYQFVLAHVMQVERCIVEPRTTTRKFSLQSVITVQQKFPWNKIEKKISVSAYSGLT